MTPVIWTALWMIPVATLVLVLWRRETRRLGATPSPLFPVVAVVLVLAGGLLYYLLGYQPKTGEWLADYRELRPMARQLLAGEPASGLNEKTDARALAMTLQRELAVEPTAPGWYTLGLVFNEAGRPDAAAEAARHALKLAAGEQATQVRLLLARSLINQANGRLTGEAEQHLRQVLAEHPRHDSAWTLLAMAASRSGRHEVAVEAFESLLARHRDTEVGAMLEQGLAKARAQARRASAFAGIRVTVTAADAVEPGGTLFLFLRHEGGGGQPLAARRYLVDSFPLTLELRAQDWLQGYPEPSASLVLGARYSHGPGASVETASMSVAPVPLRGEPGDYHARLRLQP